MAQQWRKETKYENFFQRKLDKGIKQQLGSKPQTPLWHLEHGLNMEVVVLPKLYYIL